MFHTKEYDYDKNFKFVYKNLRTATIAIVITHEVDRQECGNFLDKVQEHFEITILDKNLYVPP